MFILQYFFKEMLLLQTVCYAQLYKPWLAFFFFIQKGSEFIQNILFLLQWN